MSFLKGFFIKNPEGREFDPSRREFFKKTALAASGLALGLETARPALAYNNFEVLPASEETRNKFNELCEFLGNREISGEPHRLLTDARFNSILEVRRFFSESSFSDLCSLGVVRESDIVRLYTDPYLGELWRRKCDLINTDDAQDCSDIMDAVGNSEPRPISFDIDISSQSFIHCDEARGFYNEANPENEMFNQTIDGVIITALSVHELMPPDYQNAFGRIQVYRVLCDAGFQPQNVPAVFDSSLSFGAVQMIRATYEGQDFANAKEQFGLPQNIVDCLSLDDQLKAAAVLQFRNLRGWMLDALDPEQKQAFTELFAAENFAESQLFVASFLGACHHAPVRAREAFQSLFSNRGIKEGIASIADMKTRFFSALADKAGNDSDEEITRRYAESMDQLVAELNII